MHLARISNRRARHDDQGLMLPAITSIFAGTAIGYVLIQGLLLVA